MKRLSQTMLFMIVLAILARTAVNSFIPEFDKQGAVTTAASSDWAEESAEEDDSREDDKSMNELIATAESTLMFEFHESITVFTLLDQFREITVPPPQA